MSARNWDTCPRCLRNASVESERRRSEANKAYGKVTPQEYARLQAEAEAKPDVGETLREDYEVGISATGGFYVVYRGECQEPGCGFLHTFKHEQQVQ